MCVCVCIKLYHRLPRWLSGIRLPRQETWETQVRSLGREDPLEEGKATHSSVLAKKTPWTEDPGGYQSEGSQTLRDD